MENFLHCSVQLLTSNQVFFFNFNFYSQPGFLGVITVSESAKDLGNVCAQILPDHIASANQYVYGLGDIFRVIASSQFFFGLHFSLALMDFPHTFIVFQPARNLWRAHLRPPMVLSYPGSPGL